MTETSTSTYGVWKFTLTGTAADEHYPFEFVTTGFRADALDDQNLLYRAGEAFADAVLGEWQNGERVGGQYDDLPAHLLPLTWEITQTTNEFVNPDGSQTYFVTVFSVGQGFGGHEEGGWWFNCGEPVKHFACRSYDEAQELREKLRTEGDYVPTGRRSSVLPGDDYDTAVDVVPGVAYPTEYPHYE